MTTTRIILGATALLLVAPSAVAKQCFDDVPQFKQGVTLKILKNGWFSHDLQAEVAGILLSERMGFDVEYTEIGSSLTALKKIVIDNVSHPEYYDMNFELWVGGKESTIEEIGDGMIAGGKTTMIGKSGWYVPGFTRERFPTTDYYRGLQQRKVIQAMPVHGSTPDGTFGSTCASLNEGKFTHCPSGRFSPRQCQGDNAKWCAEFYSISAGYDQGANEALWVELNLNFTGVYGDYQNAAGEKISYGEFLTGLNEAKQSHIMYYWDPDPLVARFDYKAVLLPPYSKDAWERFDTQDPSKGGLNTDWKVAFIEKVANLQLPRKSEEAMNFFKAFGMNNPILNDLFKFHKDGGGPYAEHFDTACAWLKTPAAIDLTSPWVVVGRETCSPGEFKATATSCKTCVPGTFFNNTSVDIVSSCYSCPKGFEQPELKGTSCSSCPAGAFAEEEGTARCKSCKPGFYQPRTKSEVCTGCPDGSFSNDVASTNRTACECQEGYYGRAGDCEQCPEGGVCCNCETSAAASSGKAYPGCTCGKTGSTEPFPDLGFTYSNDPDADRIVICHTPEACQGGPKGDCSSRYGSKRCGDCNWDVRPAVYRFSDKCLECASDGVSWLRSLSVIILVVGIIGLLFACSVAGIRVSSLFLLTNFCQVISLLSYFKMEWSDSMKDVITVMSFMNVNVEIFAFNCVSPDVEVPSYIQSTVFSLLIPMFAALGYALIYGLTVLIWRKPEDLCQDTIGNGLKVLWKSDINARKSIFINSFLMFLTFMYTFLTSLGLEAFICNDIGGVRVMRKAPWLDCYDSEWNERLPVHIIALLLYGLGIPCVIALWLKKSNNKNRLQEDMDFRRRYGCLFKGFKADCYWWDVFAMGRKLAFTSCTVIFQDATIWQALAGFFVLTGFLVCEVHVNPFRLEIVNILQSIIDVILLIVLVAGMLMSSNFITDSQRDQLSTFMIVIVILGVVIAFGTIFIEVMMHLKMIRDSRKDPSTLGMASDPSMASMPSFVPSISKLGNTSVRPAGVVPVKVNVGWADPKEAAQQRGGYDPSMSTADKMVRKVSRIHAGL